MQNKQWLITKVREIRHSYNSVEALGLGAPFLGLLFQHAKLPAVIPGI